MNPPPPPLMAYFKNIISTVVAAFQAGPRPPVCGARNKCAVCLSSLNTPQEGTRVLPCRHEFHAACVDRWLAVPCFKNRCPVCRFSVDDGGRGSYYYDNDDDGDHEMRRSECFLTEEMIIWFSSFHVAGF